MALYKRAQILVADIWACCGGAGYGAFSDIDAITAFADYRIPQVFIWFGVLQYSDALMNTLRNSKYGFLQGLLLASTNYCLVIKKRRVDSHKFVSIGHS